MYSYKKGYILKPNIIFSFLFLCPFSIPLYGWITLPFAIKLSLHIWLWHNDKCNVPYSVHTFSTYSNKHFQAQTPVKKKKKKSSSKQMKCPQLNMKPEKHCFTVSLQLQEDIMRLNASDYFVFTRATCSIRTFCSFSFRSRQDADRQKGRLSLETQSALNWRLHSSPSQRPWKELSIRISHRFVQKTSESRS